MDRKIGRVILTAICVIAITLTAGIFITSACGVKGYVMQSASMDPEIKENALCLINTNIDYDSIETGDVIAFDTADIQGQEITMISRVSEITQDGMITQGDANPISDGLAVTEEGYIGKEVFSIAWIGNIVNILKINAVRYCVYTMIILLIVFVALWGTDGQDKSEGQKTDKGDRKMDVYSEKEQKELINIMDEIFKNPEQEKAEPVDVIDGVDIEDILKQFMEEVEKGNIEDHEKEETLDELNFVKDFIEKDKEN